jgi:small subunit ribosomal protein S15
MTKEEVEEKVLELARAGHSPAKIGLLMRDQHGIPNLRLVTGARLTKHLASKGVKHELPEDLAALLRRAVKLNTIVKAHPKDHYNKRRFQLLESKIRRLEKYYRRGGRLPKGWRYSLESAAVQAE